MPRKHKVEENTLEEPNFNPEPVAPIKEEPQSQIQIITENQLLNAKLDELMDAVQHNKERIEALVDHQSKLTKALEDIIKYVPKK